jgi:hypothetical protein
VTTVTYKVQAVRSTGAGTAAEFHVNFGGMGTPSIVRIQIAA